MSESEPIRRLYVERGNTFKALTEEEIQKLRAEWDEAGVRSGVYLPGPEDPALTQALIRAATEVLEGEGMSDEILGAAQEYLVSQFSGGFAARIRKLEEELIQLRLKNGKGDQRTSHMLGTLFQWGDFTLASGQKSDYKLECDALTIEDWKTVAAMIAKRVRFREVIGVPSGGLPLADSLRHHQTLPEHADYNNAFQVLFVDDVYTTGGSMDRTLSQWLRDKPDSSSDNVLGVVLFARNPVRQQWIHPIFGTPRDSILSLSSGPGTHWIIPKAVLRSKGR